MKSRNFDTAFCKGFGGNKLAGKNWRVKFGGKKIGGWVIFGGLGGTLVPITGGGIAADG